MGILEFFKPNKEKILIAIFAYAIFYILDAAVLTPAERFYTPIDIAGFSAVPFSFWVLRFFEEAVRYYLISCFAFWYLQDEKVTGKKFEKCMEPTSANLMITIVGYATWYASGAFLYHPLLDYYLPPATEISPVALSEIRLFVHLITWYLMASFAVWLKK